METVLKENTYLNNTEAPIDSDYGNMDYITAMEGETVNVWVQPMIDGYRINNNKSKYHHKRYIYYTAYRKTEGVYYANTRMRDENGIVYKNCGGMYASQELKQLLG